MFSFNKSNNKENFKNIKLKLLNLHSDIVNVHNLEAVFYIS